PQEECTVGLIPDNFVASVTIFDNCGGITEDTGPKQQRKRRLFFQPEMLHCHAVLSNCPCFIDKDYLDRAERFNCCHLSDDCVALGHSVRADGKGNSDNCG